MDSIMPSDNMLMMNPEMPMGNAMPPMMPSSPQPMMQTEHINKMKQMYPDVYKTMYPVVQMVIDSWVQQNPWKHEVTPSDIGEMVEKVLGTLGITEDPSKEDDAAAEVFRPMHGFGRGFSGRRPPFRDLSKIFLLQGLQARRNPYYYYPCDPYDPYCPYYF